MRSLHARVALRPSNAGGRTRGVDLSGRYRPHLRVSAGDMLGVELVAQDASWLDPGESADVELKLLYDIDYSSLQPGVSFTIIEGSKEVGTGIIL